MIARFKDLCIDAADARHLADFWARILGGEAVDTGDGDARVDPRPGGKGPESIWVNQVPEPRTGKTRVHLDLRLAEPEPAAMLAAGARLVREPDVDLAGPDPTRLIAAGATLLREPDADIRWWVLADPEGNEFCAFAPRPAA
ncbi:VOC family protein [Micromonospora olivasterospora]|uniref:Glyoxalase-like domain-containing protein n=1 Tax=Micromonospora olivasterospora TaxID=1880 RepID=A0A562I427_MICOL|nr:VOC family protein [Micromonospora olivasterospora]TWH65435.1 hypothetical protein JD77_00372 [Micromonospora olivasterospora]